MAKVVTLPILAAANRPTARVKICFGKKYCRLTFILSKFIILLLVFPINSDIHAISQYDIDFIEQHKLLKINKKQVDLCGVFCYYLDK